MNKIVKLLPGLTGAVCGYVLFNEALINSSMNYQSTKKGKCDFPFFIIFNDLLVIENGSTSLCCGNSELISVSLITYRLRVQ